MCAEKASKHIAKTNFSHDMTVAVSSLLIEPAGFPTYSKRWGQIQRVFSPEASSLKHFERPCLGSNALTEIFGKMQWHVVSKCVCTGMYVCGGGGVISVCAPVAFSYSHWASIVTGTKLEVKLPTKSYISSNFAPGAKWRNAILCFYLRIQSKQSKSISSSNSHFEWKGSL